MKLYIALASAVTILMGVVTFGGWRQWPRLSLGARLVVVSVGIHFLAALVSVPLVARRIPNQQYLEIPQYLATLLTLIAFRVWQPRAWQRRTVDIYLVVYTGLWLLAEYVQGGGAPFAKMTSPLHSLSICAGAGFTLVNRVSVTWERWTSHLWFWICIAMMVDYGTEVILAPLMANLFGVRTDLVRLAHYVHLVGGVVAYGLVSWRLWWSSDPILPEVAPDAALLRAS